MGRTEGDGMKEYIVKADFITGDDELVSPEIVSELIRCKDCKWFRRWINTDIEFCDLTESNVFDTDYCSRADRREE